MGRHVKGTSKAPCRAATTANITLSATQTIDGIAIGVGDRVLVKNQTSADENGIYVCQTGTWTRADDFDHVNNVLPGSSVYVTEGTVAAGQTWVLSNTLPLVVDTTDLVFTPMKGRGQLFIGATEFAPGTGTWTPGVTAANDWPDLVRTAAASDQFVLAAVNVPGAVTGYTVMYNVLTAIADDVRCELIRGTIPAEGAPAGAATVLCGALADDGTELPAGTDTPAERQTVDDHTLIYTVQAANQVRPTDQQFTYLKFIAECAGAATSVVSLSGVVVYYD